MCLSSHLGQAHEENRAMRQKFLGLLEHERRARELLAGLEGLAPVDRDRDATELRGPHRRRPHRRRRDHSR